MSQMKNGAWSQLGSSSSPRDSSKYFLLEKFSLEQWNMWPKIDI